MNIFHIVFATSAISLVMSWHQEADEKLIGSWSDDAIRVSIYEESGDSQWTHRMVLEVDGSTIRKWGVWKNGVFEGSPSGAMPNSMTGSVELAAVPRPRGLMICNNLIGYGVSDNTQLLYERRWAAVP